MAENSDLVKTMGVEAAKAAPPTVVAMYGAVSTHLPEIVGFATLLYIILQAGHLTWKWVCQIQDRRRAIADHVTPPAVDG